MPETVRILPILTPQNYSRFIIKHGIESWTQGIAEAARAAETRYVGTEVTNSEAHTIPFLIDRNNKSIYTTPEGRLWIRMVIVQESLDYTIIDLNRIRYTVKVFLGNFLLRD